MSTVVLNSDQFQQLIDKIDMLQATVSSLERRLGRTLFTLVETAEEWEVSTKTVRRWIKARRVKTSLASGKTIKFDGDEVLRVKKLLLRGIKP